jgi:hypothetical protein
MESKPCAQAICTNQAWEVCKIIGKEVVNGVLHYWVHWAKTLEPKHSLGDAKEIVDKFEARLSAKREVKKGKKGLGSNRSKHMAAPSKDTKGGSKNSCVVPEIATCVKDAKV